MSNHLPEEEPPDQISLLDVESTTFPRKATFSMPRRMMGLKIFKWLLWLVVGMVVLLAWYGWATFPRVGEFRSLAGHGPSALAAYSKARADWVSSVKDLGQLFIVTPVLPLLSAVLGYMFGRNEADSNDPDE